MPLRGQSLGSDRGNWGLLVGLKGPWLCRSRGGRGVCRVLGKCGCKGLCRAETGR